MKPNNKAFIIPAYVAYLAVAAIAAFLFVAKPKHLDGESKRADNSAKTTADLQAANDKKGGEAAASVTVIGQAAAAAPKSPEQGFIVREVSVALSKLPPPDAQALLEAEKRKNAVLEGKIEESNTLYKQAFEHSAEIQNKYLAMSLAKQRSDLNLQETAALHLGAVRERDGIILVCILLVVLYIYTKITHLSLPAVNELATDIKNGANPLAALDGVTSRFQQKLSRLITKLK